MQSYSAGLRTVYTTLISANGNLLFVSSCSFITQQRLGGLKTSLALTVYCCLHYTIYTIYTELPVYTVHIALFALLVRR